MGHNIDVQIGTVTFQNDGWVYCLYGAYDNIRINRRFRTHLLSNQYIDDHHTTNNKYGYNSYNHWNLPT